MFRKHTRSTTCWPYCLHTKSTKVVDISNVILVTSKSTLWYLYFWVCPMRQHFGHSMHVITLGSTAFVLPHLWHSWGYCNDARTCIVSCANVLWVQIWSMKRPWPIKQCRDKWESNTFPVYHCLQFCVFEIIIFIQTTDEAILPLLVVPGFVNQCPVRFAFTYSAMLHYKYCLERIRAPCFQKCTPGYPWSSNP